MGPFCRDICEIAHLCNQKEMGLVSNIAMIRSTALSSRMPEQPAALEATRQARRFYWWRMLEDVLQQLRCLWLATLICTCPHVGVSQELKFYCSGTDWASSQHMLLPEDLLCWWELSPTKQPLTFWILVYSFQHVSKWHVQFTSL